LLTVNTSHVLRPRTACARAQKLRLKTADEYADTIIRSEDEASLPKYLQPEDAQPETVRGRGKKKKYLCTLKLGAHLQHVSHKSVFPKLALAVAL
jgi:hypothetical protein